mmetsp:Transcript_70121/g.116140  ORF Transcript_70121/g.116140 Transcript_70121/m.116140 type:complete len:222 (+) Transcript_70121:1-666(+)
MRTIRGGEECCESAYTCSKCCVETDIFCMKFFWKLFSKIWSSLHSRTQAMIILGMLMSVTGIAVLWWFTERKTNESDAEVLLMLMVRWTYLGCVMCCLPGLMCLGVICCEAWACLSDVTNNLGDYILEAATDVVEFQHAVTDQSVKSCTSSVSSCWQGCKNLCSGKDDSTQAEEARVASTGRSLQVAMNGLQAVQKSKPARKFARPIIMLKHVEQKPPEDD